MNLPFVLIRCHDVVVQAFDPFIFCAFLDGQVLYDQWFTFSWSAVLGYRRVCGGNIFYSTMFSCLMVWPFSRCYLTLSLECLTHGFPMHCGPLLLCLCPSACLVEVSALSCKSVVKK